MPELTFNILEGFEWAPRPGPAAKALPSWWRDMKRSVPPGDEGGIPGGTARVCSPFEDALGLGYVLPLPFQAYVECDAKGETTMRWNGPPHQQWELIGTHSREQLPGVAMGLEDGGILKFQLPYSISLPEGYAALYTHPLNRHDLPFQSFSGVVDAGYDSPVNVPFMWIAPGANGFLDAGVPVAQVVPFRIEDWEHGHASRPWNDLMRASAEAMTFVHGYRRKFAKKRVYN